MVWDGRFDAPVHAKADVKKVDNPRGLPTFFAWCLLTKPPLSPRAPGERFVRRAPSNSLRSRSIAAVVTPRPQRNLRLCLAQRLRGQANIAAGGGAKFSPLPIAAFPLRGQGFTVEMRPWAVRFQLSSSGSTASTVMPAQRMLSSFCGSAPVSVIRWVMSPSRPLKKLCSRLILV